MRRLVCAIAAVAALYSMVPFPSAATETTPFVRGVYGRDSSATGLDILSETGFNAVTVQPWKEDLDGLSAAGLTGVVWLFGYDNETCSFARDDEWVRSVVSSIAGHPAILAYQVADEPNAYQCPEAPEAIAQRAELVRQLDPSKPTYTVVAVWDGREGFPYQHFAGTTDIMGIDVYPCSYYLQECVFSDIDKAIAEAEADGVDRMWAVVQDFSDTWYRTPTADELRTQFDRWAGSGIEGYFVYHWNYGEIESRPDHLAVLSEQNLRDFGTEADTVPPSRPSNFRVEVVKARVGLAWNASTDDRAVTAYEVARGGSVLGTTASLSFDDPIKGRGTYEYSVVALDAAGNRSAPATLTVSLFKRSKVSAVRMCAAKRC